MTTTLIFDCDGVLADTERYGHLPAFNRTFEEFGLPVHWSDEDYATQVLVGGGKERMRSLLTPAFVAAAGLPTDREGQDAAVAAWHRRKTEIYTAMVAEGTLPGRPGVRRIIAAATAAGWQLAVASTSAEPSVRAVLRHVAGTELAAGFAVFAGDVVPAKKPAPDIYRLAIRELAADPRRTVVVEDSRNGFLAATGAGLPALITVNDYTEDEDFSGAALVVSSLGDPGEPATVLANRTTSEPGPLVDLTDLEACMAVPIGVPHGG